MRIWYKLEKQKANNQRKFGAKNREAERELAAFLIPFCLGCGWWLEVSDSAPVSTSCYTPVETPLPLGCVPQKVLIQGNLGPLVHLCSF